MYSYALNYKKHINVIFLDLFSIFFSLSKKCWINLINRELSCIHVLAELVRYGEEGGNTTIPPPPSYYDEKFLRKIGLCPMFRAAMVV